MKKFVFYIKKFENWTSIMSSSLIIAICLTGVGPLTVAHACPPWSSNTVYQAGDEVSYNGNVYKALVGHTSEANWDPMDAPSLWELVSGSSISHSPKHSNSHKHSNSTKWSGESVQYNVGDQVTYNGSLYECLVAHTSEANWDPVDAPGLWKLVSGTSNAPFRGRRETLNFDPNTYYYIRSQSGDLVLDIQGGKPKTGNPTRNIPIVAYTQKSSRAANQLWRIVPDGNGYDHIQSKLNGLVLDIQNGDDTPGTVVDAYTQNDPETDNQLWTIDSSCQNGGGYIRSKLANLVLDIQGGGNPTSNTAVDAYTQNDPESDNQLWTLDPALQNS